MFAMTQPSNIFTGHLGCKTIISSADSRKSHTMSTHSIFDFEYIATQLFFITLLRYNGPPYQVWLQKTAVHIFWQRPDIWKDRHNDFSITPHPHPPSSVTVTWCFTPSQPVWLYQGELCYTYRECKKKKKGKAIGKQLCPNQLKLCRPCEAVIVTSATQWK